MGNHSKRILIVGADRLLCDLLHDILAQERAGDWVQAPAAFPEATLAATSGSLDLLIVDASMSGADGLMLIQSVQTLSPQTDAILITAADQDEIRERSHGHQTSFALFTKPFSIDALLQHIDCVLSEPETEAVDRSCAREWVGDRHVPHPGLAPSLSWA